MRRFAFALLLLAVPAAAQQKPPLQPVDMFELEYAAEPRISPDGRTIAYERRGFDMMTDRPRANIWLIDVATGQQRPLLSGTANYTAPRWSPDGKRIAFVSAFDRDPQIYVRWIDSGAVARVTNLPAAPGDLAWSPDGTRLAFTMFVPTEGQPFAKTMPKPPKGATWAAAPKVIEQLNYRADGAGYLDTGDRHIFVVASDGGSPRQLTRGAVVNAGAPRWIDNRRLVTSANLRPDREREPADTELHRIDADTGVITAITDRRGPDEEPAISRDGRRVAWLGFDDRYQGNQRTRLYVTDVDAGGRRELLVGLDRDAQQPVWAADGRGVYFRYDDEGVTRLGLATLDGKWRAVAAGLGGEDLGRPYGRGDYSVSDSGAVAMTITAPDHPADIAVLAGGDQRRLTRLNDSLFRYRTLGQVEPISATSTGGAKIGGWIVKPPGFDPAKKYPLLLEIHGGPFTNYGPRFAAEMQAFAAAGYVVLYANPRGSTSYGEAFANHIHHAYPGDDYDDLIAITDATIAKGYIDPARLFVTGGSGGGVLTAWIVGKTDRFRAAVVSKPVINWTSFVLTSDLPGFFWRYWFGRQPWEAGAQAEYWRRSPLSLVGNVKTPTMVLTGEQDWRTPISESEQYYTALKLRGVPTALVRVPDIGHALVTRPTQLIAKTQYILAWFARHGGEPLGPVTPAAPAIARSAAMPPDATE